MYSPLTMIKNGQKKYQIDKNKKGLFFSCLGFALLANVLVALIFTREIYEILLFALANMIFITYSLTYLILLKPPTGRN